MLEEVLQCLKWRRDLHPERSRNSHQSLRTTGNLTGDKGVMGTGQSHKSSPQGGRCVDPCLNSPVSRGDMTLPEGGKWHMSVC